jgi:hypothetical protein
MNFKLSVLSSLFLALPYCGFGQLFQTGDRVESDFISLGVDFDNSIRTDARYKHITAPKGIEGPLSAPIASSIWVFEAGIGNNYHSKYFTLTPTVGIKWVPAILPFVFAGADYRYNISSNAKNYGSIRYNYGITIWGMANIGISSRIFDTNQQEGIQNFRHYLFLEIPISILSTNLFDRNMMRTRRYKSSKEI